MADVVLGSELLKLADVPVANFPHENNFYKFWLGHPDRPGFYAHIDYQAKICYFRIGETIYKTPCIEGDYHRVAQEMYRLYDLQD